MHKSTTATLPWTTPALEDITDMLTAVEGGVGVLNDGVVEASAS